MSDRDLATSLRAWDNDAIAEESCERAALNVLCAGQSFTTNTSIWQCLSDVRSVANGYVLPTHIGIRSQEWQLQWSFRVRLLRTRSTRYQLVLLRARSLASGLLRCCRLENALRATGS